MYSCLYDCMCMGVYECLLNFKNAFSFYNSFYIYVLFHFSFSSQNIAYVGIVYVGFIKHRMHLESLWLSSQMGMNIKIGFLTIILKDSSIIHCIWLGSGEKEKNESDE